MGIFDEVIQKKMKLNPSLGMPVWLNLAESLPNRNFVTETEKELIDLLRKVEKLSKAELVNYTEHSRTKITGCIESLLNKKIIIANEATEYTGGRRSKIFSINGNKGIVAGVDIGATSIDIGIADFTGMLLARYSEPASVKEGPLKTLGRVCTILEKLVVENQLSIESVQGIGIGVPGPVDFSMGTLISPPIMPGWDQYPIVQTIQQWFPSANVVVDNDVNVMALGETYQGAGKGIQNLIFVKIGTGIGAGIICEGKIYRGSNGCAGDIGHIGVKGSDVLCHCGNRGCLEAVAAGPAIAQQSLLMAREKNSKYLLDLYEKNEQVLQAEDIGDAARQGDPVALDMIRQSGHFVGEVLAGMVNFYNPEMIVIGGGVSNIGNNLLSSIRQTVLNRSLPLATRDLQIVFSKIGMNAGVIGAVNLAMDYMYTISADLSEWN